MGWGKESAKNPQEVGGANAEITRGPPRGRELWRGAVAWIRFVGRKFHAGCFLGGIFGGIFLRENSLFIFYF